jgi:hypothetical protein
MRLREALESGRSPYRDVPYDRWDEDPAACGFRRLAGSLIACSETLARERAEREARDRERALRAQEEATRVVEAELARVKSGLSYRLGLALTWLPRKIARRR